MPTANVFIYNIIVCVDLLFKCVGIVFFIISYIAIIVSCSQIFYKWVRSFLSRYLVIWCGRETHYHYSQWFKWQKIFVKFLNFHFPQTIRLKAFTAGVYMALMAAATRNTLSYNSNTKQKASQKVVFIIAGCNFLYNLKNMQDAHLVWPYIGASGLAMRN